MAAFNQMTPEFIESLAFATPYYLVDEAAIEHNLQVLDRVQAQSGAKILLALKGFAMWSLFPLIAKYLNGVTASSLNEAMLGRNEFQREVHVYAPAYSDQEFPSLLSLADGITFNSLPQWLRFRDQALASSRKLHYGIRINPEHSEVKVAIYDPCAKFSRLGVTLKELEGKEEALEGLSGFHFHTLCELNSDSLERTLSVVEKKFGAYFHRLKWINFGGGHHISRPDYEVDRLIHLIKQFKSKYEMEVYLEPGEAIALQAGVLVATVLDVIHNGMDLAVLDTSATAHMPDVIEMPYRPVIIGADLPQKKRFTYRLGGLTCLAGDVIGDYSFDEPLQVGQKIIFKDMAHYTMVKNTFFNGVPLPSIASCHSGTGKSRLIRTFGYDDYKNRLS